MNVICKTSILCLIVTGIFSCASPATQVVTTSERSALKPSTYGQIVEFPIPNCPNSYCQPIGIARGPDGQMWFATYLDGVPGEVNSAGVFTQFELNGWNGNLLYIAAGPDGNLWMTAPFRLPAQIVKMSTSGAATFYNIPWGGSKPLGISAGGDGNIWFCDQTAHAIGRVTPDGTFTKFTIGRRATPESITSGPDGNVWFTDNVLSKGGYVSKIGSITMSGAIKEFTIYNGRHQVFAITNGPDGDLWYTAQNRIGRISVTGQWHDYRLPNPSLQASGIATGPDGNVWITEVGEIIKSDGRNPGLMSEYFIQAGGDQNPLSIAAGADGNMWFTVPGVGAIGTIELQ